MVPAPSNDRAQMNIMEGAFSSQNVGQRGLSLRGVAFMTILVVVTVLQSTLPSFRLSYKIQDQEEATVTAWTILAVSAVIAVSVGTATPPLNNPLFFDIQIP